MTNNLTQPETQPGVAGVCGNKRRQKDGDNKNTRTGDQEQNGDENCGEGGLGDYKGKHVILGPYEEGERYSAEIRREFCFSHCQHLVRLESREPRIVESLRFARSKDSCKWHAS